MLKTFFTFVLVAELAAFLCHIVGLIVFGEHYSGYALVVIVFAIVQFVLFAVSKWKYGAPFKEYKHAAGLQDLRMMFGGMGFGFFIAMLADGLKLQVNTFIAVAGAILCLQGFVSALRPSPVSKETLFSRLLILALVAITCLAFVFLPPISLLVAVLERLMLFGIWAFSTPSSSFMAGLVVVCIVGACMLARIVGGFDKPIDDIFVKLSIWMGAFSSGLYITAVRESFDITSPVKWWVAALGWIPWMLSNFWGYLAGAFEDREWKNINFAIGVVVFAGVLLFVFCLEEFGWFPDLMMTCAVVCAVSVWFFVRYRTRTVGFEAPPILHPLRAIYWTASLSLAFAFFFGLTVSGRYVEYISALFGMVLCSWYFVVTYHINCRKNLILE